MIWIGIINIIIAIIEIITALKNRSSMLLFVHLSIALMFVTFSIAAFNENIWIGIPAVLFGFLGIIFRSKNRKVNALKLTGRIKWEKSS